MLSSIVVVPLLCHALDMRSSSNPFAASSAWPAQMNLSCDDHAQPIRQLLFIRQAWNVAEELELLVLNPVPDTGTSALPEEHSTRLWQERWLQMWSRVWAEQAGERCKVPGTGQVLEAKALRDQDEFWTSLYGTGGFDYAAFARWENMFDPAFGMKMDPILRHPKVEPTLIAAWERGLRRFTLLPWAGYYAHRLSDSHLVTSFDTAGDPALLQQSLAQWIRNV